MSRRSREAGGPLNALKLMVARAVVRLVDDAAGLQSQQLSVLADELAEDAEVFAAYGLTSHPRPGAEAVLVYPGGQRGHALVIAVGDRRYRLTGLAEGEVALHDDQGQSVQLRRAGIRLVSPFKVEIETPQAVVLAEAVHLGGTGGKAVARHDDPVVAGKVQATSTRVFAQ